MLNIKLGSIDRKVEVRENGKFFFEVSNKTSRENISQIREILNKEGVDMTEVELVEFEVLVEKYGSEYDLYLVEKNFKTGEIIDGDNHIRTYKTKQGVKNRAKKLAEQTGCGIDSIIMR